MNEMNEILNGKNIPIQSSELAVSESQDNSYYDRDHEIMYPQYINNDSKSEISYSQDSPTQLDSDNLKTVNDTNVEIVLKSKNNLLLEEEKIISISEDTKQSSTQEEAVNQPQGEIKKLENSNLQVIKGKKY